MQSGSRGGRIKIPISSLRFRKDFTINPKGKCIDKLRPGSSMDVFLHNSHG